MKKIIEYLVYKILKLFKVVRNRYYLVDGDNNSKQIYITQIPTGFHDIKTDKNYHVIGVISELVNETLVYNWIKIEKT